MMRREFILCLSGIIAYSATKPLVDVLKIVTTRLSEKVTINPYQTLELSEGVTLKLPDNPIAFDSVIKIKINKSYSSQKAPIILGGSHRLMGKENEKIVCDRKILFTLQYVGHDLGWVIT